MQWNGYDPATLKTRLCGVVVVMFADIVHEPSSRATLCWTASLFVQVITSPTEAATALQVLFATVASTSAAVPAGGSVQTAAADVAPDVAAGGFVAVPPEQAARASETAIAEAVRRLARMAIPPSGARCATIARTHRSTSYGSAVGGVRIDDPELARRLVLHEARAQEAPARVLRDLGDGWLVHDTNDAEPYWNRVIAPSWPAASVAFDRRLDEVITLFATIDRLPHVRPLPLGGGPPDLPRRLQTAGFEWLGADRRMVLLEPERAGERLAAVEARVADAFGGGRITVTRHGSDVAPDPDRPPWAERRRWARDASLALEDAFGVDPGRRVALENDILACVARPGCSIVLIRVDGEPAAIARRAATGDGSYLSSIGTRPAFRRRGLGSLATALAVADALEAGSPVVHLSVEVDNDAGFRLYESLGFAVIGEPAPDLLLR